MKTIKIFLFLISLFIIYDISAYHYKVNSKKKFYEKINSEFDEIARENKLAIAYINVRLEKRLRKTDRPLYNKLKNMKDVFKDASSGQQEVRFITAELPQDDFYSLIDELGIKKYRKIDPVNKGYDPIIILFKKGKIAKDKDQELVILSGFISRYQIDKIVYKTFKKKIKKVQEKRKKEYDRQEELRVVRQAILESQKETVLDTFVKESVKAAFRKEPKQEITIVRV